MPSNENSRRTIQANGAEIRRLRLKKGWSQQHLIDHSGLDRKTIIRVEGGGDSLPSTFARLEEVLNAPRESLIISSDHVSEAVIQSPALVFDIRVSISATTGLPSPEQVEAFMNSLRSLIGAHDQTPIVSVRKGSVIISVALSARDALSLANAFVRGELAALQIESLFISEILSNPEGESTDAPPWQARVPRQHFREFFFPPLQEAIDAAMTSEDQQKANDARLVAQLFPRIIITAVTGDPDLFMHLVDDLRSVPTSYDRLRNFLLTHWPPALFDINDFFNFLYSEMKTPANESVTKGPSSDKK